VTKSIGLSRILFERCSPLKERDLWNKRIRYTRNLRVLCSGVYEHMLQVKVLNPKLYYTILNWFLLQLKIWS